MRTKFAWLGALLLLCAPAQAQTGTPKSKSVVSAEIGTCFPDNTFGLITPSIVRSCIQDFLASWQQYAGVNAQVGTTYTIVASDYGQLITFNNSGSIAVTLPQAIGSFLPFNVYVTNLGTGLVTITPTTSTINGSSTFTVSQGQSVWIVSDGTNYQVAKGFGSGVVNSGTAGQLGYYATTGSGVSGTPNASIAAGALTLGASGTPGSLSLGNATSGTVTVQPVTGALSSSIFSLPAGTATAAALNLADQTIAGGANITSLSQATGNINVDCGVRPAQFITNNGNFTVTAPTNDGYCILKTVNSGSAGTISFSGFSVGSNTGDALTIVNNYKFLIFIYPHLA